MKQYLKPGDEVTAICLAAYIANGEFAVDNESLADLIYTDDDGNEWPVYTDGRGAYYMND
jgi:hypothetical protein